MTPIERYGGIYNLTLAYEGASLPVHSVLGRLGELKTMKGKKTVVEELADEESKEGGKLKDIIVILLTKLKQCS